MIEQSPPLSPSDAPPRGARLRRGPWLWVVAALAAVVVVWAGYCAWALVKADHRLKAAVSALDRDRSHLHLADLTTASGKLRPDLAYLRSEFSSAHRLVAGPALEPLRALPWLGVQLRSVEQLSGAATEVVSAGQFALDQTHRLLDAAHSTPPQRLAAISQMAKTTSALERRLEGLSLGPSQGLVAPLAAKRARFASDLAKLKADVARVASATAAASSMLEGHHTYLLLAANNAEMRDGSGMFLEAGALSVDNGHMRLGGLTPTQRLVRQSSPVPVTGDLKARWGFAKPNLDYRNLALSPRFPANARLAAQMWKAQSGQKVSGVIAVDVVALKYLLAATGPVKTPAMVVTSANVEHELLVKQYAAYSGGAKATHRRHQELASIASSIFKAAQAPGVSLPKLAKALARAVAGRHLMVWSANKASERRWVAAGASGHLGAHAMLLGVINLGGNKLDPYLKITSHLSITPAGPDTEVQVVASVTNRAPPGLPSYVEGRGGKDFAPPQSYDGVVSLDFPGVAGDASVLGHRRLEAAGPDGSSTVLAAAVFIAPGHTVTRTFRFRLAGSHGSLQIQPSARVPPTVWTYAGKTFTDATAHEVTW